MIKYYITVLFIMYTYVHVRSFGCELVCLVGWLCVCLFVYMFVSCMVVCMHVIMHVCTLYVHIHNKCANIIMITLL